MSRRSRPHPPIRVNNCRLRAPRRDRGRQRASKVRYAIIAQPKPLATVFTRPRPNPVISRGGRRAAGVQSLVVVYRDSVAFRNLVLQISDRDLMESLAECTEAIVNWIRID